MRGTKLTLAKLQNANLTFADLSHVDLSSSDLSYVALDDANLTLTNLEGTDLRKAFGLKQGQIEMALGIVLPNSQRSFSAPNLLL
jgi:uncharacterized protein YjbI with pentapeptide repeats